MTTWCSIWKYYLDSYTPGYACKKEVQENFSESCKLPRLSPSKILYWIIAKYSTSTYNNTSTTTISMAKLEQSQWSVDNTSSLPPSICCNIFVFTLSVQLTVQLYILSCEAPTATITNHFCSNYSFNIVTYSQFTVAASQYKTSSGPAT